MACGTFTTEGVSAAQVPEVEQMFKAAGAKTVTTTPDGNNTFTVVAEFDPCPAKTSHDPGS